VWTTGPSFLIALTLYGLIGLRYGGEAVEPESLLTMGQALASGFDLSGWLLLPPLLVLGLVLMRVAALPSLILGMLAGVVAGMLQGVSLADLLTIAFDGFNAQTGVAEVDDLLSRGGMVNMSGPIMIILCAMCFGGVMEQSRMLEVIANAILERAKSRGGVVVATLGTCLGINVTTADQYLSIVVPARMYRPAFARHGLHAKNLSRCLEDGGTITSPLIPWNSCGAYMFATLGVFPFAYLPFAFLNLLNPILSAIYGFTGWTMTLAEKSDED
jgi:NhaC family Na+:H+ antiporter